MDDHPLDRPIGELFCFPDPEGWVELGGKRYDIPSGFTLLLEGNEPRLVPYNGALVEVRSNYQGIGSGQLKSVLP